MFQNLLQFFPEQFFPAFVVTFFVIALLFFVWKTTYVREIPVVATGIPFGNFGEYFQSPKKCLKIQIISISATK
jgi:hypothetical protein